MNRFRWSITSIRNGNQIYLSEINQSGNRIWTHHRSDYKRYKSRSSAERAIDKYNINGEVLLMEFIK